MGRSPQRNRLWAVCTVLVVLVLAQAGNTEAAPASSLSRWLSKQAVPDLRDRLGRHPRYENQHIALVSAADDALSAAIVTVLLRSFPGKYGVQLRRWQPSAESVAAVSSIDELGCSGEIYPDYLLRVTAARNPAGRDEVRLQLVTAQAPSVVTEDWYWKGSFSAAERDYLRQKAESGVRDGSLSTPWREADAEAAAAALSQEFACALRPQIQSRMALDWEEQSAMPGVFADTVNISRHLLGNYRELGVSPAEAAYAVDVSLVPLRKNIWQLWLIGAPRRPGLLPVQAVTYFFADIGEWPPAVTPIQAGTKITAPPSRPLPGAEARDFLGVKLLDATQTDARGSRAALQVTLQLENRAEWPLEYSFTLSGGHFNHCIATPAYYRHDRYGSVDGSLSGGETVVRRLLINNAEHNPKPLLGKRKCAGFRDLEGFEEYSRQGHKVTDYVRWQM